MSSLYVEFYNNDFSVDVNSNVFIIDASSNNVTCTLPEAVNADGQNFSFKRQDTNTSNTVSVVGITSSETIDGNVSLNLNPGDVYQLVCWEGVWYVIA